MGRDFYMNPPKPSRMVMEISIEDWNKLVDIVRDLNKSISMHVDNPTGSADKMIMEIAVSLSNRLRTLTQPK